MCSPRLSSMRFPLKDIGVLAAELLMRQIHGESVLPVGTLFSAHVEARESTARPPS